MITPVINFNSETDTEINSNEIDNNHQRDTFLHVKDEICESTNYIPTVVHNGVYDEAKFKNFNNIQVYNSDEDNNSNLSSFINSQTRIKV